MEYKTPELQKLLLFFCTQYPAHKDELMKLESLMAEIDLSIHDESEETFRQSIDLITGDTIELTWNVDQLIEYSRLHTERIFEDSPCRILDSLEFDFSPELLEETVNSVKQANQYGIKFKHKVSYILTATPLFTNGCCIVDGNHRFIEALLTNKTISRFEISGDECTPFLQKNSQSYINILKSIRDIIGF